MKNIAHLKFKAGTKERCLSALDRLNLNNDFEYIRENMIEETADRARKACVDFPVNDVNMPPMQGIARVSQELADLSRVAHTFRGRQNSN